MTNRGADDDQSSVFPPDWADPSLSARLPILRDEGESQRLEFMRSYPQNGHELAKEIAAFASTNAGMILIGVADDGSLIGLPEAETPSGRDAFSRRLEGICTSNVRPSITPVLRFAVEDGHVVMIIEVPHGTQPIYYSAQKPYIRHLTQSRPAEPHEVIERIESWLQSRPRPEADGQQAFLSELAALLIGVLIAADEFNDRNVNPWLDVALLQFSATAQQLRAMASSDLARREGVDSLLRELADNLDNAANHRLVLGGESWRTLVEYVTDAAELSTRLKRQLIDGVPLSQDSRSELSDLLSRTLRQFGDLERRSDVMINSGRVEELRDEISRMGELLLKVSHYNLEFVSPDFADELRSIARQMHLMETERLYMDGGASIRRMRELTETLYTKFRTLLSRHGLA